MYNIIFKGINYKVKDEVFYRRKGSKSPELEVLILENGKKIFPAHFSTGLARISTLNDLFKKTYGRNIRHLVYKRR